MVTGGTRGIGYAIVKKVFGKRSICSTLRIKAENS